MTETTENELIWLRPAPGGRRPRLSREQITAAALGIADSEGFEAVTMKRIAAELGSGTMTLYYYVRTKADVVALMHDAMLADLLIPAADLPSQWRDAVAAIARRTRDVLLAHPWSLSALNEAQFGPNAMHHIEQSLAAVDELDLDPHAKLSLWAIVDDYVFGSALHTIETIGRIAAAERNPAFVTEALAFGRQQLDTGRFPRLAALAGQTSSDGSAGSPALTGPEIDRPADPLAEQFERGLQALLDGLAARLATS